MPLVTVHVVDPAPAVTSSSSSPISTRYCAAEGKALAEATVREVAPDVMAPESVVHAVEGALRNGLFANCSRATVAPFYASRTIFR